MGIPSRLPTPSPWRTRATAPRSRSWRPTVWLAACVAAVLLSGPAPSDDESPRVASRGSAPVANVTPAPPASDPIARAKQAIADCQARYTKVRDYTCTFLKRERLDGRLSPPHVMEMKARAHPTSIYFKFRTPNKGREAIYVAGRHGGKVLAHDVGIGKLLAGTMTLDPRGEMAMEDCRHPITEAGLGALIETVAKHWNVELTREESLVTIKPNMRIGSHDCTMIETVHPSQQPHFLFHKVRLYVSHEHGLPIRFEAFDWPTHTGAAPEMVEEYTYLDVRLNVGLGDRDFDPKNRAYSFGRF